MILESRENFLDFIKNNCTHTDVLYNRKKIVIIRVKSFKDCNKLFYGRTSWCISSSERQWNNYVNGNNREQYFIIDFNKVKSKINSTHNKALIGFTTTDGHVYAAHARNDRNLIDNYKSILKSKGVYKFLIENKIIIDNSGENDNHIGTCVLTPIVSFPLFVLIVLAIATVLYFKFLT